MLGTCMEQNPSASLSPLRQYGLPVPPLVSWVHLFAFPAICRPMQVRIGFPMYPPSFLRSPTTPCIPMQAGVAQAAAGFPILGTPMYVPPPLMPGSGRLSQQS